MYEISVEHEFEAAHYLSGYRGKCEKLHGHHFRVVVKLRASKLDRIGIAYDFTILKSQLGQILARSGMVIEGDICRVLHQQLGLPLIDFAAVAIEESVIALIREDLAKKYTAIPIELEGRNGTIRVAMADPLNQSAIDDTASAIPDAGPATPYPSPLVVSGVSGVIAKLTITVSNIVHT